MSVRSTPLLAHAKEPGCRTMAGQAMVAEQSDTILRFSGLIQPGRVGIKTVWRPMRRFSRPLANGSVPWETSRSTASRYLDFTMLRRVARPNSRSGGDVP